MTINVNGRDVTVDADKLDYTTIVQLAGMPGNPSVAYSAWITCDTRRTGTMFEGCTAIELVEGMRFSVMHTGNA